MKLSIITINYNNFDGLRRTMDSVIDQTWKDFEYIVIDGGSQDGSKDIISSRREHLAHWVSEPDTGIYNAMNKGIAQAQGEYCLFLNSGDFLVDTNALAQAFKNHFDSDIVSFALINTDRKTSFLNRPPHEISLYSFVNSSLSHPSTFIKRSLFDLIGYYDESYKIISDWIFFINALIINKCTYTAYDSPLSIFDRSGSSISTENSEYIKKECIHYLNDRFPLIWKDINMPEAYMNALFYLCNESSPILKNFCLLHLKIINRVLRLRNKLRKKISVDSIRFSFPDQNA